MYLMFGDEADHNQDDGKKFLMYGAIFVPTNTLAALHREMERARSDAGLVASDSLKSSSRSRPAIMSAQRHRELKQKVTALAREVGKVKLCTYVILHALARNQSHDDLVLFGANTVLGKFNAFLDENKSFGYAVLDNIPVKQPFIYLKEKFQVGLTFQGRPPVRLDRILGLSQASDGTSHLSSVADIMLGSFRYCVNEPENEEAGKAMFPTLISMMWKRERNGKSDVSNCGLVLRPTNVQEAKHEAEYDTLTQRLQGYLDAK